MRFLIVVCLSGFCIAVCLTGFSAVTPTDITITRPVAEVAPMPQDAVRGPKGAEWLRGRYHGIVTDVTDRSITIVYPGGGVVETLNGPGMPIEREIIPLQPPKTFQACKLLAEGGFSQASGASDSYRLSDVRVGDRVSITWRVEGGVIIKGNDWPVGGVDVCNSISIERRPGGRVPPGQVDDFNGRQDADGLRWHDWCNAKQDFEEKGIPIPDQFLPLRERKLWNVAPMPREVTLTIPLAKP